MQHHPSQQSAAALSASLRHRIEKLAARYSRRLGFPVGVEYGETDDGQEWAVVGTNVPGGLLVTVLAGAGLTGGHVLTGRSGHAIGGSRGERCPRRLLRRADNAIRAALNGARR